MEGVVGEDVGESREGGSAQGSAVGAGEDHMEFVAKGVGGAVRTVTELVREVPAGGEREELVGGKSATLSSKAGGWRGVCVLLLQGESGMEAEIKIEGRTVQVRALDVRLVLPQCTVQRFKIAMSKRSPVNQGTDP